jgi:hypothetical protein
MHHPLKSLLYQLYAVCHPSYPSAIPDNNTLFHND